jgi:2-polyprenyl-3-methyl-5-hydroxy-6-metoxy-1,4-benzoquinol methylase
MTTISYNEHDKSGPILLDRGVCPLCKSLNYLKHINFPDIPVFKCTDCGFIYSGKIMTQQGLELYYKDSFGSDKHLKGQIINAQVNMTILSRLLNLNKIEILLDVGCGYGFFIKKMLDKYKLHQAIGLELSDQEVTYAVKELKLDVRNFSVENSNLKQSSFDLVTSFEVIEHLINPPEFLEKISSLVKPGGYLVVMTDNFESRIALNMGEHFPKWIPHSHISHFGPKALISALEKTPNFKIQGYASFNPWELELLNLKNSIFKKKTCGYNFREAMKTEMVGAFKLFSVRLIFNQYWAIITYRKNLNGALMYIVAQRCI